MVSLSRNNLETCSPSTLHADDDAGRVDRSNQPDVPGLPKNNEPDFGRQHLLTSPRRRLQHNQRSISYTEVRIGLNMLL